jgi:hypothetical protein
MQMLVVNNIILHTIPNVDGLYVCHMLTWSNYITVFTKNLSNPFSRKVGFFKEAKMAD